MLDMPSIQPNSPWLLAFVREGALRTFEGPEEERVIRMTLSLYGNIASPVAGERPCYIWKGISYSKVCLAALVYSKQWANNDTHSSAILVHNRWWEFRGKSEASSRIEHLQLRRKEME